MARVKIESIIENLRYGMKRALQEVVFNAASDAVVTQNQLFRAYGEKQCQHRGDA